MHLGYLKSDGQSLPVWKAPLLLVRMPIIYCRLRPKFFYYILWSSNSLNTSPQPDSQKRRIYCKKVRQEVFRQMVAREVRKPKMSNSRKRCPCVALSCKKTPTRNSGCSFIPDLSTGEPSDDSQYENLIPSAHDWETAAKHVLLKYPFLADN